MIKKIAVSLITLLLMYSCGEKTDEGIECPQSYFIKEFPKRNINFAHVLGSTFAICSNRDTAFYEVQYDRKNKQNTIVNSRTKDTIFSGKISRYKGLFFLSEKKRINEWHIQSLRIKDNLIYGFNTMQDQMCKIDELVGDDYTGTVEKHDLIINPDSAYELTPIKKIMKKTYSGFMDQFIPDTLVVIANHDRSENIHYDREELVEDREEGRNVSYFIFPNPFTDQLIVETGADKLHRMEIIDFNGQLIREVDSLQKTNTLDLSMLKPGTYLVRITDSDYNTSVTRIIKE